MTLSSHHDNNSDLDVNSLLNNREFQEMLQDYFQSNMTLDEFLENLPRFMMENYGNQSEEEEGEEEEEQEYGEEEFEDEDGEIENFAVYLQRVSGSHFRSLDPSENLFRSLLVGRLAAASSREIPLRTILPQSPPPSPVPNLSTQRGRVGPPLPARPPSLRRIPSQLRRTTSSSANPSRTVQFDPNAPDECKSPYNQLMDLTASPLDRNNSEDLPMTREFMRRYGHRAVNNSSSSGTTVYIDEPER